MKIRNGFVSNSSSSSFTITKNEDITEAKYLIDKDEYAADYYECGGRLFTSFISDCSDLFIEICSLAEEVDEGTLCGEPYLCEDDIDYDYVCVQGERGVKPVYIPNKYFPLTQVIKHGIKNIIKKIKEILYEIKKWICEQ